MKILVHVGCPRGGHLGRFGLLAGIVWRKAYMQVLISVFSARRMRAFDGLPNWGWHRRLVMTIAGGEAAQEAWPRGWFSRWCTIPECLRYEKEQEYTCTANDNGRGPVNY